jgi:hypothetical protein
VEAPYRCSDGGADTQADERIDAVHASERTPLWGPDPSIQLSEGEDEREEDHQERRPPACEQRHDREENSAENGSGQDVAEIADEEEEVPR